MCMSPCPCAPPHSTGVVDDNGIHCPAHPMGMEFELRQSTRMEAAIGHTAWVRTMCSPPPPDFSMTGSVSWTIAGGVSAGGLALLLVCGAGFYAFHALRRQREGSSSPPGDFELHGHSNQGGAMGGEGSGTLGGMKPIDESEEASLIANGQPVGLVERLQHQLGWHMGDRGRATQGSSSSAPSDSYVHAAESYAPLYEERTSSTM